MKKLIKRFKECFKNKTFKYAFLGVFGGLLFCSVVFAIRLYWIAATLPSVEEISQYRFTQPSIVYDIQGRVIAELGVERRYPLESNDIPDNLKHAVVAVEDSRFYDHNGIDPWGIMRAMLKNVQAGRFAEGGSTLTQQLVKNIYFSPEKKIIRKYKEAVLAYRLDNYLTKDEILAFYLNYVNFGRGGYGVQSAAINYFGKNAKELTLAECALLAGIPRSPRIYSPHINMERSKQRRDHVLLRMHENGYITEAEYLAAVEETITITDAPPMRIRNAGYFLDYVLRYLSEDLKIEDPQNKGLHVYTTLDIDFQTKAESAIQKNLINVARSLGYFGPVFTATDMSNAINTTMTINSEGDEAVVLAPTLEDLLQVPAYLEHIGYKKAVVITVSDHELKIKIDNKTDGVVPIKNARWARKVPSHGAQLTSFKTILSENDIIYVSHKEKDTYALEQDPPLEGALLSVDPKSGSILSMVGGFAFEKSMYNRTWQAKRQVGSVFKPLVYSAAIEKGLQPMNKVLDAPLLVEPDERGMVWRPKNSEDRYFGETTLKEGITRSRNIVTIRVAEQIGIRAVLEYAKKFGITTDLPADLSITLGSGSISLMEMVYAYCAFPNMGTRPERPYFITKVEDMDGNVIFEAEKPEQVPVLQPATAQIMTDILMNVVERGTGFRAKQIPRPIGAKTGTSNESRDAWFVGFLPNLSVGVWMGFDDFNSEYSVGYGSQTAGPAWVDYILSVLPKIPREVFPVVSSGVTYRKVGVKDWELTDEILPLEDISFEPYKNALKDDDANAQ